MPPKTKRARQSLEAAAKAKEARKQARLEAETGEILPEVTAAIDTSSIATAASEGATTSQIVVPSMTETQVSETEVSPDAREKADILEEFVEEWVCTLDRDDKKALGMLLCLTLANELSFTETRAAELTAKIVHKSDRTVRQWRTDLIANNGVFPESKQGLY